jgi:hypothetical protein
LRIGLGLAAVVYATEQSAAPLPVMMSSDRRVARTS